MTEQERQQAFLKVIEDASKLYGVQLNAQVQARTLGPIVQCEAVIALTMVADWQPLEPRNGKPILTEDEPIGSEAVDKNTSRTTLSDAREALRDR